MKPKNFPIRPRRIPLKIPINSHTAGMFNESEIINLSKGGVFIRSDIPLPLGSTVDFEFMLPHSDRSVSVSGVVVWIRSRNAPTAVGFPNHSPGMGIQFRKINVEDMNFILDELERLVRKS